MGREGDDASSSDAGVRIGRWMFAILFWGALLVGGSVGVHAWLTSRSEARAPRVLPGDSGNVSGGTLADGTGGVGLELTADRRGHYVLVGLVDGREVEFLVDTGASEVAIPAALADELGLRPGRSVTVQTANGRARARATSIDSLSIGPLSRHDVPATIVPGMTGRTALLGMSFLRHFDLLQRGGRLVIRTPGVP